MVNFRDSLQSGKIVLWTVFDNLAVSNQQSPKAQTPKPFTAEDAKDAKEPMNPTPIVALVAEVYAKVRCMGMAPQKPTPIWDDLG
jgi:hypothetical protein